MAASRNPTDGSFESIIARWDLEDLQRARDQMREVLTHPGYDTIRLVIEEAIENAQTRLVLGPVREQADYARAMGFLAGMRTILDFPQEIISVADAKEKKLDAKLAEDSAGKGDSQ